MKVKYIIHLIVLLFFSLGLDAQEGTYFIQSAIGGKYLDVQWGKADNNTPLHLWPENQGVAQKFTLEDAGSGYFYIKSHVGRNKYLHIQNRSRDAKALVVIWEGKGNENTKWFFEKAGNGYYLIKSMVGTYLDVKWGNAADGTPIWMWERNAGKAQKWRFMQRVNNRLVAQRLYGNGYTPVSRMGSIPLKNLPVKVTVQNIRTTFGDDGGDANFEYYTKIRIREGWNWRGRDVQPKIYPKYSHDFFRAAPSGTNRSRYPYTTSKALINGTSRFKVYISLYDYDDASGDDWVDIHPERGTRDLQLYIDTKNNEIFYQNNGRRVVVGYKGDSFQLNGSDSALGDKLTADITLKIDWEN